VNGIVITQAALHAALLSAWESGSTESLYTLARLFDPKHAAGGGAVWALTPGAARPAEPCNAEAGTPAPPTIELPAGPGEAAHAASDTPAGTGAPSRADGPSGDPTAEGRPIIRAKPRAPSGGGAPVTKWTAKRLAVLRAEFPTSTDRDALLRQINALPGDPIASTDAMRNKALALNIRADADVVRAIQTQAGARGGRASVTHGPPTKPSEVRTAERFAAFPALWMDPALSVTEIQARMNAMPGKPLSTNTQLYGWAKKAGLPTQRPLPSAEPDTTPEEAPPPATEAEAPIATEAVPEPTPEPPPEPAAPAPEPPADTRAHVDQRTARASAHATKKGATLPAVQDDKADAFDAFEAGQSVRDVHADFGLPLSTLSNWHSEWKLARRQDPAA
jgi:hypothetical protein